MVRAFAHGANDLLDRSFMVDPWSNFFVPASAPQLVQQRMWYVLSCLWDDAYKRTLAVNRKE